MRNRFHRNVCVLLPMVLAAFALSGCFNFDFGSAESIDCGPPTTPESVASSLEDRYALGAVTTLSVSGLDEPEVTSSDPDVVIVSPIQDQRVTLYFVGEGTASIEVEERDLVATATIEVARVERFEVVLPSYFDPWLPLEGRAVIDPELQVLCFDEVGRLHGARMADTTWTRVDDGYVDMFYNDSLEPGPQQVEVRVEDLVAVIDFEAVARDQVQALSIVETEQGDGRIRVDAVGVTESGTQVWNIDPIFWVDDQLFLMTFEYLSDPGGNPMNVVAESLAFSLNGPIESVETTIYGTLLGGPQLTFSFGAAAPPIGGKAPLFAFISLLLMTLLIRPAVRAR